MTEFDETGAAVDVGQRINIGDGLVKIRLTDFGLNLPSFSKPSSSYVYPYQCIIF